MRAASPPATSAARGLIDSLFSLILCPVQRRDCKLRAAAGIVWLRAILYLLHIVLFPIWLASLIGIPCPAPWTFEFSPWALFHLAMVKTSPFYLFALPLRGLVSTALGISGLGRLAASAAASVTKTMSASSPPDEI